MSPKQAQVTCFDCSNLRKQLILLEERYALKHKTTRIACEKAAKLKRQIKSLKTKLRSL